ncbi:Cuticle protein 10.9, partial [Stegodyphus mimosarum]
MFKVLLLFTGFVYFVDGQNYFRNGQDDLAQPTPYQFSYTAPADGGGSTHEESGDGYGRVTGSYTVQDEDGRSRIVQYVADEGGFRASISTNEPGTSNQNPADVTISSSADEGYQALASPAPAVIPTAPAAPVAIAPIRIPQQLPRAEFQVARPVRQPIIIPAQPAAIPVQPVRIQPAAVPFQPIRIQPAAVPVQPVRIQPTAVPIQPVQVQPAYVSLQPAAVPVQPTYVRVQPAAVPIETRRFVAQPVAVPVSSGRFITQPAVIPIEGPRILTQPAVIPIGGTRILSQPAVFPVGGNNIRFIRPYGDIIAK